MRVGADFEDGTCRFVVWAPNHHQVTLSLPIEDQWFDLDPVGNGYWTHTVEGIDPNTQYLYRLDGDALKPDPASNYQPNSVFGASAVVDHDAYKWADSGWCGLDLADLVFYELHVGTFTPEGTLKAAAEHVGELADLGVTALELMPLNQFSGKRNWGYDGVFPYAVQNSYGFPDDFKALVDQCHRHGVALFLDVVINHLGPEGNCLNDYGPYFPLTQIGRWGPTVNLDGAGNEGVRNYFQENVLYWFNRFHIDGIRLDAILFMPDNSPTPFLAELTQTVHNLGEQLGKKIHFIAETSYNVPKVLMPTQEGGFGFEAQWLDDFQHALHALLTGEREGYYRDYGRIEDVAEVLREAYVYVGGQSSYKRRQPSESTQNIAADRFVVFGQNHDQVGNRLKGDRLATTAGLEAAKLAAGLVLLSPYLPLLFMGEEYGETAPFLFFTDYSDQTLIESIREGRKKEFEHFHWTGEVPDPQSTHTFLASKLNWQQRNSEQGKKVAYYYRDLLVLRKNRLFRPQPDRQIKEILTEQDKLLLIHKASTDAEAVIAVNFSNEACTCTFPFLGEYLKVLDSADAKYAGSGVTLPQTTTHGHQLTLAGFTLAVYHKPPQEGEGVG